MPISNRSTGDLITAAIWNSDLVAYINNIITAKSWLYVDGQAVRPDLTNGCDFATDATLTGGRALQMGAGFSGTADQFCQFKIPMPKSWNAGTLTYRVRWTSNLAGAGDVVWSLQASASSDGESIDQVYGTAINVTDTFQGTSKTHKTAESSAMTVGNTPVKEDIIYFRLGRLATNGSDTKAEKVFLEGLELFYTTDTVNDA